MNGKYEIYAKYMISHCHQRWTVWLMRKQIIKLLSVAFQWIFLIARLKGKIVESWHARTFFNFGIVFKEANQIYEVGDNVGIKLKKIHVKSSSIWESLEFWCSPVPSLISLCWKDSDLTKPIFHFPQILEAFQPRNKIQILMPNKFRSIE